MKKMVCVVAAVLMLVMPLFAQATAESGPKNYQTLQMYTALDTEEAHYYLDVFQKSSGINVEYLPMRSGEVLARM